MIRGKKVVITLWDDVMQVFQQIMTVRRRGFRRRTTHLFTIKTKEGTDIRLGNLFEGIVEIGETVQDEVTRRLLPDILARYKMGEAIQYTSTITLNKEGIQVRNKAVDWGDIEGF
ncbi:MAG: hypothetical protein KAG66_22145, partial [Methylococcales bacterium]|nr:hypothetical protein [Methylococcales bacterium]